MREHSGGLGLAEAERGWEVARDSRMDRELYATIGFLKYRDRIGCFDLDFLSANFSVGGCYCYLNNRDGYAVLSGNIKHKGWLFT